MTIKRRLAISNILMIVIPTVIALIIALGTLLITWYWVEEIRHKEKVMEISYDDVTKLVLKTIESKTASTELDNLLTDSHINVIVTDESGEQYKFGKEKLIYNDILLRTLDEIGGEGFININDEGIYTEKTTSKGINYTISLCLLYDNGYGSNYYNALNLRFISVIVITIVSVVFAIIIANHFLTRFVFTKIKQSLDLLADGVHEIRDGNLDYRIVYEGNDEITPICEDFNNMALRLHQSVELTHKQEQNRKELLAGISHDLRSPLTSIKAYVEGLLDGVAKTPLAQNNYMQMIKTKADDIDHMVSKLFLFSKMDMGDYPYYPEVFDLKMEITFYVQATREEYLENGLKILMEQSDSNIMIFADPLQLRSILTNILENSLKYKDKPEASAIITVNQNGSIVRIMIEDNGPGVPDEALDKLFDVFYRSDTSRSNPNKGSGIGLAITAKAITHMGGIIYAQNASPCGLRIIIEIPVTNEE